MAKHRSVLFRWLFPVLLDRSPTLAEAILVSIPVLRNESSHPLRMCQREPQTDWRTVIEEVDCIAVETNRLGELVGDLGDVLERVGELLTIRRINRRLASRELPHGSGPKGPE